MTSSALTDPHIFGEILVEVSGATRIYHPSMLHLGRSSVHETYYNILSVTEDASYDEIRASYKNAVLNSHPDKIKDEKTPHSSGMHERFLKVQKAWEVLGNSESRAVYDRELSAAKIDFTIADEVKLEEMKVEDVSGTLELLHPCRCGDAFSISSTELEEIGFSLDGNGGLDIQGSKLEPASIVIPCCSCSLKIHLLLDAV